MKFVLLGNEGSGTYRLATADDAATSTTTTLKTSATGTLDLKGLNVGEYSLKETKAPDDYVLLKDPIAVTIVDEMNADGAQCRSRMALWTRTL